MKRVCVFCGSSFGVNPAYAKAANDLGNAIAKRNICLVYGGARVGLMGEIASTVIRAKGEVIGVIPKDLVEKEVAHGNLSDLRIVGSMHERKSLMAELSDGFIALPGGFGTIEEIFEVITWAQLSFHDKPCGFLNINGYYDHLIKFLDHSLEENFIVPEHRAMIIIDDDPESLLDKFLNYVPPKIDKAKWILGMMPKEEKGD
ncbi:MAG: TIGR00730 family Rossman fold protein [Ignavibacteriaceae bacterium]|nr:TIGR00730 family Rossman fold protein [Ignavibacteriaceae bacterium]